jgi:hypothetical protein
MQPGPPSEPSPPSGQADASPLPQPPSEPQPSPGKTLLARHFLWLSLFLASGAGLLAWFALRSRDSGDGNGPAKVQAEPDPRLSYQGPFKNIHPSVNYVGDAACVNCHFGIHDAYRHHPMGRSLTPVAEAKSLPPLGEAHNNPFTAFGSVFHVEKHGKKLQHRQVRLDGDGKPIFETGAEAHFLIGSGTRGYSFLTNRDGYLFQTPVSWFSQKKIWDKSPGFAQDSLAGRPTSPECLFCHSNHVVPVAGHANRYEEPVFRGHAIGCERCHGPGEVHVNDPGHTDASSGADYTIVNPRHLEPALREAVCQQCHLAALARFVRPGRGVFDFRPGLPLESFWGLYVLAEDRTSRKAVNHVEQMYLSRCFKASSGTMGCITCHDPHHAVSGAERVAYFRDRCLQCHAEQSQKSEVRSRVGTAHRAVGGAHPTEAVSVVGCALSLEVRQKKQPDDSCMGCHMPRYAASDIAHTAATDHRIPRRPEPTLAVAGSPDPATPPAYTQTMPLVPFHRGKNELDDPEAARDLAIALVHGARREKIHPWYLGDALGLVDDRLRIQPDDLEALQTKGLALALQGRRTEALAALMAVLDKDRHRESLSAEAAQLAQALGQKELARRYWGQAVDMNPWQPLYRAGLANVLAKDGAWDEAASHLRASLKLDPENVPARHLWVMYLHETGKRTEARAELETLRVLAPANAKQLEAWLQKKGR